MFDFHEKRKIRRVVYSRFFIVGIFLITALIMMSVYERFTIEREMALKLSDRMQELETLQTRAATLEARVKHLRNERGIEEELRNRFDVVKEGEQVVVIIDDKVKTGDQSASSSATSKQVPQKTFFEKLLFWRQ